MRGFNAAQATQSRAKSTVRSEKRETGMVVKLGIGDHGNFWGKVRGEVNLSELRLDVLRSEKIVGRKFAGYL